VKLISKNIYCDYNATSPLSKSVIDYFAKGDFYFGNPSSIHTAGKNSKRLIRETNDYLFNTFNLDRKNYQLFYHSGATEGINNLLKGFAYMAWKNKKVISFYYSPIDHSCVQNSLEYFRSFNHKTFAFPVDENGNLNTQDVINFINKTKEGNALVNFTSVNNETGFVWDLSKAKAIKEETGAYIHVDSVQAPGKIENWSILSDIIDAYTFSAHKFGAMKGVGFSFVRDGYPFIPIASGGGQQNGLRSGTENILGIYSIKLALEDLINNFQPEKMLKNKMIIENHLLDNFKPIVKLIGQNSERKNLNTIYFMVGNVPAHNIMVAFDMAGLEVSSGSACSSGTTVPSRVLKGLGFSDEQARCGIRLSFGVNFKEVDAKNVCQIIDEILPRFFD